MLNRSKLLAAGLLLAAFVAGAAVGSVASAAWGDDGSVSVRERSRRMSYAERLQSELALSADQRDAVDAILQQREHQMDALWQEIRPRFDSLRAAIRREIKTLLTDPQHQKYQALIERSDSLRALHRKGRGRHGKK